LAHNPYIGCLLGTAVGDSLGLPYEGLSARRAAKLFPDTSKHHLVFGKGMVSDDTEHAAFVAQALIHSRGNVDVFQKRLARSLRWWFLALPAGVGFATARSILKLWIGFSPQKSGVFSAGNGPAMRSPVLGVACGHNAEKLKQFVKASTEITHSDPKAYYAALAVALAAHQSTGDEKPSPQRYLSTLKDLLPEDDAEELHELLQRAAVSADNGEPVTEFASNIGSRNGISATATTRCLAYCRSGLASRRILHKACKRSSKPVATLIQRVRSLVGLSVRESVERAFRKRG